MTRESPMCVGNIANQGRALWHRLSPVEVLECVGHGLPFDVSSEDEFMVGSVRDYMNAGLHEVC